jgi:hypothetical protein
VHLKRLEEASGDHGPTARLAIYHERQLPSDRGSLAPCFARTALLFVGEHCRDGGCTRELLATAAEANRGAKKSFGPRTGDWEVRVAVRGKPTLRVHRVVGKEERVLAREVDGMPMSFAPLQVNGHGIVLGPLGGT